MMKKMMMKPVYTPGADEGATGGEDGTDEGTIEEDDMMVWDRSRGRSRGILLYQVYRGRNVT